MKKSNLMWGMISLVITSSAAAYDSTCGDPFVNHVGPFDYRTMTPAWKRTVEMYHFTPSIEALSGIPQFLSQDLNYTLTAIPNHPRALKSMSELFLKTGNQKPDPHILPIECYFERAMLFRPDDPMVRLAYGIHFYKRGKIDQALEQMKEAEKLQPNETQIGYNLGLLYFEKKDYEQARKYAKTVYERGFALPGLKNKLMKVGKWEEGSSKN